MGVDIDFVKQVFVLIEKSDWSEIKKEASEVKDEFCRRNKLDEKFVSIYGQYFLIFLFVKRLTSVDGSLNIDKLKGIKLSKTAIMAKSVLT